MMEQAVIEQEIEQGIAATNTEATGLMVTDAETYQRAGELLKGIKAVEKRIKDYFSPLKAAAHKAWKSICDRENEELLKLKPGADHLNRQMVAYHQEQERIRQEEERRQREEARRREEEERLAAAIEAEKTGQSEVAEAILNEPVHVAAPVVPPATPKIAGQTVATTWKHRVVSLQALVRAVADGKAPITCLQANDVFLGSQARAGKGQISYPGVEFYPEQNMRGVRSR